MSSSWRTAPPGNGPTVRRPDVASPRWRAPRLAAALVLVAAALAGCHSSPRRAAPDDAVATRVRDCDAGDLWSCTWLGFAYQLGDEKLHVPIDWKLGAAYFERACTGKVPEACVVLYQMYELGGKNLPADLDRAVPPLRILCSEGYTDYCGRKPEKLPYAYHGDGVNPERPTP